MSKPLICRKPIRAINRLRYPIAALLVCLFTVPALAEQLDREKPVNLQADHVTVDDANKTSTFEGNVVLTQGTLIIRGDKLTVTQDEEGFQHGTTYGNLANFRQKSEKSDAYVEGYAERIEYDNKTNKIQMFNRAYLKKGNDTVRGNYISYDETTEFYRVVGGGKTLPPGNDGRVHAVFMPKPKDSKPAPAAAPLPLKPTTEISAPREPTTLSP